MLAEAGRVSILEFSNAFQGQVEQRIFGPQKVFLKGFLPPVRSIRFHKNKMTQALDRTI